MKRKTIKVDEKQYKQLTAVKDETGIPISEQARRAIREWIEKRKGEQKADE